MAENGGRYRD